VILGSVLAFLSVFAIWTERQALNTDDWVHTSGRLLQNETIRGALSDYLVDQLYENVDVSKELEEILPGDTKDLAGPAAEIRTTARANPAKPRTEKACSRATTTAAAGLAE